MIVLAFDTTTSSCAITLWQAGKTLAKAQEIRERGHAEILVPMIEEVLAKAALHYQDLDLLAVTTGPGAFTGIRIGLATARSMALASGLPLIGISNFTALAAMTPRDERSGRAVLVVLETKRADFYACLYDENLKPLGAPKAVDDAGLLAMIAPAGALLLAGDGAQRAAPVLRAQKLGAELDIQFAAMVSHVDPAILAELAAAQFSSGDALTAPLPLYLKPPDVNLSGSSLPRRIIAP